MKSVDEIMDMVNACEETSAAHSAAIRVSEERHADWQEALGVELEWFNKWNAARTSLESMLTQAMKVSAEAPSYAQVKDVLVSRKISLIKLLRTATSLHQANITGGASDKCLGLKEAKDMVETWLDEGGAL